MNQDFGEASTKELQCWAGDRLDLFSVTCLTLGIYNGKRFVLAHVSEISEHGIGIYSASCEDSCCSMCNGKTGRKTDTRETEARAGDRGSRGPGSFCNSLLSSD